MSRRNRDTKAILRTIERSEERSPLFWWMVEHHDEMIQSSRGKRIRWGTFCAEAASKGLTDTRGVPPTERNARETWRQARKAVAAARAAEAAKPPPRAFPSRFPKDWKPEAFQSTPTVPLLPAPGSANAAATRPASSLAPAAQPAGEAPLSRYAKPDDPPEVQAAFADIEEQLNKHDWWLLSSPNKRRRD